jgi:hypothetical protein
MGWKKEIHGSGIKRIADTAMKIAEVQATVIQDSMKRLEAVLKARKVLDALEENKHSAAGTTGSTASCK